jgi:hypothetical protein
VKNTSLLPRCQDAFAKATAHYRTFFDASGPTKAAPTDEAAFYNALYCLRITGLASELGGTLAWTRRHSDANGTFHIRANGPMNNRSVYFKGWVAYGAHLAEAYDLSFASATTLARWQDSNTGGLPSIEPGEGRMPAVTDVNSTSLGILAFLVTGQIDAAVKAGQCLCRMIAQQPKPRDRFYCYLSLKDSRLLTEPPASLEATNDIYNAATPAGEIDRYTFCVTHEAAVNPYAVLSMALAAITLLHRRTKNPELEHGALAIAGFLKAAGAKLWDTGQTSKTLWGLALLNETHPAKALEAMIEGIAEGICAKQQPDGGWKTPLFEGRYEEMPAWLHMAYTGDMLIALHAFLSIYAAGSGGNDR